MFELTAVGGFAMAPQHMCVHNVRVEREYGEGKDAGRLVRLGQCAQERRVERPTGHNESVDNDEYRQPCAHVNDRGEGERHELARHVREAANRVAGVQEEPKLEEDKYEHGLVEHRQRVHVEVHRLPVECLAAHDHSHDEHVAHRADGKYDRKQEDLDQLDLARRRDRIILPLCGVQRLLTSGEIKQQCFDVRIAAIIERRRDTTLPQ